MASPGAAAVPTWQIRKQPREVAPEAGLVCEYGPDSSTTSPSTRSLQWSPHTAALGRLILLHLPGLPTFPGIHLAALPLRLWVQPRAWTRGRGARTEVVQVLAEAAADPIYCLRPPLVPMLHTTFPTQMQVHNWPLPCVPQLSCLSSGPLPNSSFRLPCPTPFQNSPLHVFWLNEWSKGL